MGRRHQGARGVNDFDARVLYFPFFPNLFLRKLLFSTTREELLGYDNTESRNECPDRGDKNWMSIR